MPTSIPNVSQSYPNESTSNVQLNPQKSNQKTSQSYEQQKSQKQQLSFEQYNKLQLLLQIRQASLRQHAKHQYQLKLFIEDLEQKNKSLQKNNSQILTHYKTQVTAFKKENQILRKSLQKLQVQNSQLKRQLQQFLSHQNTQKLQSVKIQTPDPSHQRVKSQSIIKVVESVENKQTFRQSQYNFRSSPFNMSGKQFPIPPSNQSRRNIRSQSRQKLEVTIKSSRIFSKDKGSTHELNQKNILGQQKPIPSQKEDSLGRQKSIKNLMDLKKMNESHEDDLRNKKKILQKSIFSNFSKAMQDKKNFSSSSNELNNFNQQNLKGLQLKQDTAQERVIIQKTSKYLDEAMKWQILSGSGRDLRSGKEKKSKQMQKSGSKDHDLIKLGHYGNIQKIITN